jgi:hypothetical protein
VLERTAAEVGEERTTRRPLTEAEVRALLAAVDTVVLARGPATRRLPAAEVAPDDLRGPTGNFRAPMVRRGRTLLVGFHPKTLEHLLKD